MGKRRRPSLNAATHAAHQNYESNNSKTRSHLVFAINAIDPVAAAITDGLDKVETEVGYEKGFYRYREP